jgi:hypothetical protein
MRSVSIFLANFLVHLLAAIGLVSLQSSLWPLVFGKGSAPQLWILPLCFWILRRTAVEALAFCYVLFFVVGSMTSMPMSMIVPVILTVTGVILLLKDRVLWAGVIHFTLAACIGSVTAPMAVWGWSRFLETNPVNTFHFFAWILNPLLTGLFAVASYPFLVWLDDVTQKEAPKDAETEML